MSKDVHRARDNEIDNLGFPLMDAMNIGFKNKTFEPVMCPSTMEHIGLDQEGVNARHKDPNCRINGDALAMKEIWRVLKDKGTLILTVPYDSLIIKQQGYRVHHKESLSILANLFFVVKKEFFGLKKVNGLRVYPKSSWVLLSHS